MVDSQSFRGFRYNRRPRRGISNYGYIFSHMIVNCHNYYQTNSKKYVYREQLILRHKESNNDNIVTVTRVIDRIFRNLLAETTLGLETIINCQPYLCMIHY